MKPINPELLKRLAAENRRNLDQKKRLVASIRRADGELKPPPDKFADPRNARS